MTNPVSRSKTTRVLVGFTGVSIAQVFLRDPSQIREIHVRWKLMPICFTHQIRHGAYSLYSKLSPCRLRRPLGINLGTNNIWDGRGFAPPQAIRAVEQGNYDLMILVETKVLDALYLHNHLGCDVV